MKSINLSITEEQIEVNTKEGVKPITFKISSVDLLKQAVNSPSKNGYSISEMKQRLRLLDIIEKADNEKSETIEFEDADFKTVSDLVRDTKWTVLSKAVIKFSDEFEKQ